MGFPWFIIVERKAKKNSMKQPDVVEGRIDRRSVLILKQTHLGKSSATREEGIHSINVL